MKNNDVRLTIFQLLNQNYHLWRNIQNSMNGVNIEELTTNISGKVSFTLWLKNINTNHLYFKYSVKDFQTYNMPHI